MATKNDTITIRDGAQISPWQVGLSPVAPLGKFEAGTVYDALVISGGITGMTKASRTAPYLAKFL